MKTSMLDGSGDDELFSSSNGRGYNTSFNKTRPTMISAKYRLKEERRKVLKMSIIKLKKIEDPESTLRRSVLINNTMKRLQKEAREERREKQQIHSFPRYTPSYKSFVLREEPPKPAAEESKPATESPQQTPRLKPDANKENASPFPLDRKHPPKTTLESCFCEETMDELVDVTTLDDELSRPLEELANPINLIESASIDEVAARCTSRKRSFDEDLVRPLEALMETAVVEVNESPSLDCETQDKVRVEAMEVTPASRKRSYEEVEDSEIHDVLSQFYMPPTPRMLTSIDDDEDEEVNVVDIDTIDIPIARSLQSSVVDGKVPGFEELVREELDESVVTSLEKHAPFDLLGDDAAVVGVASPCKRARFEASSPAAVTVTAAPYESMTLPNDLQSKIARPFESTMGDMKSTQSYGYLSAVEPSGDLPRTSCTSAVDVDIAVAVEVGSHNCGTVSNSLASPSDECGVAAAAAAAAAARASGTPCARIDAEIKDMKNVDYITKENCKMVDRRSQISLISERMGWTSLMHDARSDGQEYKLYNNGLCKTLADCCYQETNNNMAAETSKYSCAHAAITELQSQVYHNYVTSLES